LAATLGTLLLALWFAWFVAAEIPVRAVSIHGRLEVEEQSFPVQAGISGRVVSVNLMVGERVAHGTPLLELDSRKVRLQIEEEVAHREALTAQLQVLQRQVSLEEEAVEQARHVDTAVIAEAEYRRDEARLAFQSAHKDARRIVSLHGEGLASTAHRERVDSQAQQMQALAESLQHKVESLTWQLRFASTDRLAHLEELHRELVGLHGNLRMSIAAIARLEQDLEDHTIRAPISGRIGQVSKPQVGSLVTAAQEIASIVPDDEVRIVAQFEPSVVLGRMRPGQSGRMRLDGFSWAQYGAIPATVNTVASEARNGRVRVELSIEQMEAVLVPIEHGLTGSVEIDLEQVSPATLVLRAAGIVLARPAAVSS
jgi:membrane fusion protein (multidrug efflux system)